jgi:hypothetical protein
MQQYIGVTLDAIEMIGFFYDLAHIHGSESTCDPKGLEATQRWRTRAADLRGINKRAILMPRFCAFRPIIDLKSERS